MVRVTRKIKRRFKGIKRKIRGFVGEGFFGKTYSVAYHPNGESLSNTLAKQKITKIIMHTADPEKIRVINSEKEIAEFKTFLHDLQGAIAKVFKVNFYPTTESKMLGEIEINRKILEHYGKHAKEYLTIFPINGFGEPFIGTIIDIEKEPSMYVMYSTMCDNKYKVEPLQFAVDLLESLEVLQKSGYQHNDIKLDNIVRCDGKYKLIDWGQTSKISEIANGDMISTSPIKWYIAGVPAIVSDRAMNIRAQMVNPNYQKSEMFQQTFERIEDEFYDITMSGATTEQLFNKYKKSFDIFMVGMSLLRGVYNDSLDLPKYKPAIDALTSLKHPLTSPKKAIEIVKRLMRQG